jgi:hypothetical protein
MFEDRFAPSVEIAFRHLERTVSITDLRNLAVAVSTLAGAGD